MLCCIMQINARRIKDELNVFKDIHKSPIFIGVLIVTAGLQVCKLLPNSRVPCCALLLMHAAALPPGCALLPFIRSRQLAYGDLLYSMCAAPGSKQCTRAKIDRVIFTSS